MQQAEFAALANEFLADEFPGIGPEDNLRGGSPWPPVCLVHAGSAAARPFARDTATGLSSHLVPGRMSWLPATAAAAAGL